MKSVKVLFTILFVLYPVTEAFASNLTNPIKIGVLYWSSNIPGQVAMAEGLEAEAEKINKNATKDGLPAVELITKVAGDGQLGIENQIQQMNEMIHLKPDVIIVQPSDNAALSAPLVAANRADIPVVAYDQYISGGHLAAYLTSDNHQAGYLDGEYVASLFENKKTIRLILVEYPLVSSTVERTNGFLDALHDQQQSYTILKTYQAVEFMSGLKAGQDILSDFPEKNSVDVIFTVNDGGGLSVVNVLAKAGRTEIVVASVDGDPESVENIKNNRLTHIDAAQFCGPLGAEAIKTAYSIARGLEVKKQVLIPVFPITSETLSLYPGWKGPVPESFEKPWPSVTPMWKKHTTNM